MIYRASWRNTSGFAVVLLLVCIFAVTTGIIRQSLWHAVAGLPIPGYLYLIGRRLTLEIDEGRVRYQGWLRAHEAMWDDVTAVTRMIDRGYPWDRFYGPHCYEVRSRGGRFVFNMLYFPPECARIFADEIKRRGLLRGPRARRRRRSDKTREGE